MYITDCNNKKKDEKLHFRTNSYLVWLSRILLLGRRDDFSSICNCIELNKTNYILKTHFIKCRYIAGGLNNQNVLVACIEYRY